MLRVIFVASALAACGDRIDAGNAEELVRDLAARSVGTPVASVTCPRAERELGVIVTCRVRFAEGGEHPMELVIVNQRGGFHPRWPTPVVSRRSLAREAGAALGEAVDCGAGVEAAPIELRCRRAGGDEVVFDVDVTGAWRSR